MRKANSSAFPWGAAVCIAALGVATLLDVERAHAMHDCDALGDAGWSVVPTVEEVAEADSAPYQAAGGGDWFVDRKITVLPMCSYYNSVGNYSLRSYSLEPQVKTERISICHSDAGKISAVAPYAGACPPR